MHGSCMHACMHAIQVVKIKHPSEKANNPVDEVLFYGKAKTPNDLPETLSKNFSLRKVDLICIIIIIIHSTHGRN